MSVDFTRIEDLSDQQLADARVDMELSVAGRSVGSVSLELWPEAAPATVRNFLRYAAEGFYDGKSFHRVIAGFMIQGGCPQGNGTGSGPHGRIPGEFSADARHSHVKGVISMARSSDPNSASCQFFLCHGDASFLDGQYAAFGRLVEGEQALDAVARVPVEPGPGGEKSTPAEPCRIESVKVYSRI